MLLKGVGNRMPVSSNLIFCLKNSIYMHTRFFDLDDQRVQNLRNYLVEVLLNSFSIFFSSVRFLALLLSVLACPVRHVSMLYFVLLLSLLRLAAATYLLLLLAVEHILLLIL